MRHTPAGLRPQPTKLAVVKSLSLGVIAAAASPRSRPSVAGQGTLATAARLFARPYFGPTLTALCSQEFRYRGKRIWFARDLQQTQTQWPPHHQPEDILKTELGCLSFPLNHYTGFRSQNGYSLIHSLLESPLYLRCWPSTRRIHSIPSSSISKRLKRGLALQMDLAVPLSLRVARTARSVPSQRRHLILWVKMAGEWSAKPRPRQ